MDRTAKKTKTNHDDGNLINFAPLGIAFVQMPKSTGFQSISKGKALGEETENITNAPRLLKPLATKPMGIKPPTQR